MSAKKTDIILFSAIEKLLINLFGIPVKWTQDPGVGPGTQSPCVEPWGGALGWDPGVGASK